MNSTERENEDRGRWLTSVTHGGLFQLNHPLSPTLVEVLVVVVEKISKQLNSESSSKLCLKCKKKGQTTCKTAEWRWNVHYRALAE